MAHRYCLVCGKLDRRNWLNRMTRAGERKNQSKEPMSMVWGSLQEAAAVTLGPISA